MVHKKEQVKETTSSIPMSNLTHTMKKIKITLTLKPVLILATVFLLRAWAAGEIE
jgi:hypothetical protein